MKKLILTFTSAAMLTACSGISTTADYDPSTDFSQYATWTWLDTEGDHEAAGDITHGRIQRAVESTLAEKGLQKSDSDADLVVGYQLASAERRSYDTVQSGWGGGYGYGGWGGWGMGTSTTYENVWEEGTIVVGMFDTASKTLVWSGSASGTVDEGASPEKREQRINDAVAKMMSDFPPSP